MDNLSDQLNITASDYTIYIQFSDLDRYKMEMERDEYQSRGEMV
jgi:hypothetical protein